VRLTWKDGIIVLMTRHSERERKNTSDASRVAGDCGREKYGSYRPQLRAWGIGRHPFLGLCRTYSGIGAGKAQARNSRRSESTGCRFNAHLFGVGGCLYLDVCIFRYVLVDMEWKILKWVETMAMGFVGLYSMANTMLMFALFHYGTKPLV
jgi:hypothetical protein